MEAVHINQSFCLYAFQSKDFFLPNNIFSSKELNTFSTEEYFFYQGIEYFLPKNICSTEEWNIFSTEKSNISCQGIFCLQRNIFSTKEYFIYQGIKIFFDLWVKFWPFKFGAFKISRKNQNQQLKWMSHLLTT